MTILNEDYQLNNGVKIPKLALGTWLSMLAGQMPGPLSTRLKTSMPRT